MKIFKNKYIVIISLVIVIIALSLSLIYTSKNKNSEIKSDNNTYNIGMALGKTSSEILAYRSVIYSQNNAEEKERFQNLLLQNMNFAGETYNLSILISSEDNDSLSEKSLKIESELKNIRTAYLKSSLELNELISLDRQIYAILNDYFSDSASAYKGFADGLYDDFYKPELEMSGKSSPKISDRLLDK